MFTTTDPTDRETNEENIHMQQLTALTALIDAQISYILSLNISSAANYIDELCQELNGISAKIHELEELIINIDNQFVKNPEKSYRDNNEKFNKIISHILLKDYTSTVEEIEKLKSELGGIYNNLYNNLATLLCNLDKFYSSVSAIISTIQTLPINDMESKREQIQRAIHDADMSAAIIKALTDINDALINYTNIQSKDLTKELLAKSETQLRYKDQLQQLPDNIQHQYRQAADRLEEHVNQPLSVTTYTVDSPRPNQVEYSEFAPEIEENTPNSPSEEITPYCTGKIMGVLLGTMFGSSIGGGGGFAAYIVLTTLVEGVNLPIELAITLCAFIGTAFCGAAGFIGGDIVDQSRYERKAYANNSALSSAPPSKELETLSSTTPDIEEGAADTLTYKH